jgi:GAF domain-containing protein
LTIHRRGFKLRAGVAVVEHLIPENEQARLEAVRRYGILDTPPDGAFDRITRIAAAILDVPISIVSIVDHDRIWFKSTQGLDGVEQIGRDPGLCASAILSDTTWVVNDARVDPRTLANPLVAGEFGLQFYAGSALRTHDGYNLGTLCVIDRNPRELTGEQARVLDDLAAVVVDELELRLAVRQQARHSTEINDDVVQSLSLAKASLQIGETEQAIAALDQALTASKRILAELAEDAHDLRRTTATG